MGCGEVCESEFVAGYVHNLFVSGVFESSSVCSPRPTILSCPSPLSLVWGGNPVAALIVLSVVYSRVC